MVQHKMLHAVLEERARPAIASLGDMVGMAGDDDTGKTSHAASCP
jgi:hypothetical protein